MKAKPAFFPILRTSCPRWALFSFIEWLDRWTSGEGPIMISTSWMTMVSGRLSCSKWLYTIDTAAGIWVARLF